MSTSATDTIELLLDTDGDGMPDAWEAQYGLNPGVNDSSGDIDNDGVSNLNEYHRGRILPRPETMRRWPVRAPTRMWSPSG
jgi:hypothetical protein